MRTPGWELADSLMIDGGWLRVLGASAGVVGRTVASWNRLGEAEPRLAGGLLIADDAVGGFFAINGGGLDGATGDVCYFAPDTCAWESLDLGADDWLDWAIAAELDAFYAETRWPGWAGEVAKLGGDRAILIYPPLWAEGPPVGERSRRAVPIEELWSLHTKEFADLLRDPM